MLKEKDFYNHKVATRKCNLCGDLSYVKLTDKEYHSFWKYSHQQWYEHKTIQECMPKTNAVIREYLKTGYCKDCMEKMFGKTSNRIVKYDNDTLKMFVLTHSDYYEI